MPLPPGDVSTLARRFQRPGPPLHRRELEQDQPYIRISDHPCHLPPSSSQKTLTLREHLSRPPSSPCEGILPPVIPNRFPVSYCHHLPPACCAQSFPCRFLAIPGPGSASFPAKKPQQVRFGKPVRRQNVADYSIGLAGQSMPLLLPVPAMAYGDRARPRRMLARSQCMHRQSYPHLFASTDLPQRHGRAIRDLPGGTSSDRLRRHG